MVRTFVLSVFPVKRLGRWRIGRASLGLGIWLVLIAFPLSAQTIERSIQIADSQLEALVQARRELVASMEGTKRQEQAAIAARRDESRSNLLRLANAERKLLLKKAQLQADQLYHSTTCEYHQAMRRGDHDFDASAHFAKVAEINSEIAKLPVLFGELALANAKIGNSGFSAMEAQEMRTYYAVMESRIKDIEDRMRDLRARRDSLVNQSIQGKPFSGSEVAPGNRTTEVRKPILPDLPGPGGLIDFSVPPSPTEPIVGAIPAAPTKGPEIVRAQPREAVRPPSESEPMPKASKPKVSAKEFGLEQPTEEQIEDADAQKLAHDVTKQVVGWKGGVRDYMKRVRAAPAAMLKYFDNQIAKFKKEFNLGPPQDEQSRAQGTGEKGNDPAAYGLK